MSSKVNLLKKQIAELQAQLKVEMAINLEVSNGTLPVPIGKKTIVKRTAPRVIGKIKTRRVIKRPKLIGKINKNVIERPTIVGNNDKRKRVKVTTVGESKPTPRTDRPTPVLRKSVKQMVDRYEDIILPPTPKPRTDRPTRKSVKQMVNEYEGLTLPPPPKFKDGCKRLRRPPPRRPIRRPPLPPLKREDIPFDFDNEIFQTENESLRKFKIINIRNSHNKKFKSFTNEFKVKIFKKFDDVKEIYHTFQELIKTVKRRRKLSNNDRLRFVIENEELPDAISTKFNKVKDFKLAYLEQVIKIQNTEIYP